MDVITYALLLKRIKKMESEQITQEVIREEVEKYLKANPIIDIASLDEIQQFLGGDNQ